MIHYTDKLDSALWMRKCQEVFETIEEMKQFVADARTRFNYSVERPCKIYTTDDVSLEYIGDCRHWLGIDKCSKVLVDGEVVGYCGE